MGFRFVIVVTGRHYGLYQLYTKSIFYLHTQLFIEIFDHANVIFSVTGKISPKGGVICKKVKDDTKKLQTKDKK